MSTFFRLNLKHEVYFAIQLKVEQSQFSHPETPPSPLTKSFLDPGSQ